jgi:prephenate dehydratase
MSSEVTRIAIQGELGSNSHMAALAVMASHPGTYEILPCAVSIDVFDRIQSGAVQGAILPIENSLHGSVAEHYDLLLERPVTIVGESLLRIHHNIIVAPRVRLDQVRRVLSHPVALSQCRKWFAAHPRIEAVPFYDTAGSVKHVMDLNLRETAGLAPALAAEHYRGEIVAADIEDHAENYTRFYTLALPQHANIFRTASTPANKLSVAFSVEHRPGTLILALEEFRRAGLNLTRIESRPVPGSPWEYVFYVDVRFETLGQVDATLAALQPHCLMLKELGRYPVA